jgi:hypothetical protein
VRRSGTRLKVTWSAASGAAQYLVRIKLADGRSKLFVLGKGARSYVFKGAGADKGTVTVSGLSERGREGPKAKATVKKKAKKRRRRT